VCFSLTPIKTRISAISWSALVRAQATGRNLNWHDRRTTIGSEIENAIDRNLNEAEVILLLVSPDFINSDYCYEREMLRALERHEEGEARVIPVILRPCDWHGLPFGKLLATPADGKAVTKWAGQDDAFLDVVQSIKAALKELGQQALGPPANSGAVTAITGPPQLRFAPATCVSGSGFPNWTATTFGMKDSI
jgi:hypothetical protein